MAELGLPAEEAARVVPMSPVAGKGVLFPGAKLKNAWTEDALKIKTIPEAVRMRLNGETRAQMEHAAALKARCADTSVDQAWEVDPGLRTTDAYALCVSVLWLAPKALLFYPLFLVTQFPVIMAVWLRAAALPVPTLKIDRATCGHRAFCAAAAVLALPVVLLIVVSFLLDMVVYYFFSVLFCTLTWNWRNYSRSLAALRPYRGGPPVCAWPGDLLVALVGAVWRQGPAEATFMLSSTWIVVPWWKYFVNTNPFLYPLEERFVQQISTSMQDIPVNDIVRAVDEVIVQCKQEPALRRTTDAWKFLPHYPYPPPSRRWALGIQAGGHSGGPGIFFFLTHSMCADCAHGGSTEQLVLSTSALRPWQRVMLWYNNPYHFLTGWVEAQVSTGLPSQPDKARSGEHPMWLVGTRSPWHCSRRTVLSVGWVDKIFDEWLPLLVDRTRAAVRGIEAAAELREGVISKDGVSRPASQRSVPFVQP